jgi:putative phosphoesterase
LARTKQAIQLLNAAGADVLIHCGDLASPPIVQELAALPSWFVFGNHDSDMVPVLQQAASEFGPVCLGWGGIVQLGGRRIGVVHGHMTTDVRRVLAEQPDLVLSGHSHYPSDVVRDSVRRINPGALHASDEFTVAVLELASGQLQVLRANG